MRNEFETWLKDSIPAGQAWTDRLLAAAAACTATVAVWLSLVLMAGLDLPPSDLRAPAQTGAPAPADATAGISATGDNLCQ